MPLLQKSRLWKEKEAGESLRGVADMRFWNHPQVWPQERHTNVCKGLSSTEGQSIFWDTLKMRPFKSSEQITQHCFYLICFNQHDTAACSGSSYYCNCCRSWARFDTESKQDKENHGQMRQHVKRQMWPWPLEPLGFWISVSLRRNVSMCRNNLRYWLLCVFSVRSSLQSVFNKQNIESIQSI